MDGLDRDLSRGEEKLGACLCTATEGLEASLQGEGGVPARYASAYRSVVGALRSIAQGIRCGGPGAGQGDMVELLEQARATEREFPPEADYTGVGYALFCYVCELRTMTFWVLSLYQRAVGIAQRGDPMAGQCLARCLGMADSIVRRAEGIPCGVGQPHDVRPRHLDAPQHTHELHRDLSRGEGEQGGILSVATRRLVSSLPRGGGVPARCAPACRSVVGGLQSVAQGIRCLGPRADWGGMVALIDTVNATGKIFPLDPRETPVEDALFCYVCRLTNSMLFVLSLYQRAVGIAQRGDPMAGQCLARCLGMADSIVRCAEGTLCGVGQPHDVRPRQGSPTPPVEGACRACNRPGRWPAGA